MKILFVAHSFPRQPDDAAGAFLLSLSDALQRRGHELLAVVPHDMGLPLRDNIAGTRVWRYRYGSDSQETLAYKGTMADQVMRSWSARFSLLNLLASSRMEINRAVREWQPDVINAHWWFPGGLSLWSSRTGSIPTVMTSHGTDLFLLDRVRAARAVAGRIFRSARRVTVISTPLVERVTALGVPRNHVHVIPMPVDRAVLAGPQGAESAMGRTPVQLLFVGRLVERKGTEFAIRAAALAAAAGIDVRLNIVGDGPLRGQLEQLSAELGAGHIVRFLGQLSPADAVSAMRAADIFLMPAVTDWKGEQEGFGMVIVEALLSGTPVIASRSGGIPDIIDDGINGLLVPERDAQAMAACISRLASDAALTRSLVTVGQQSVLDRFHPDVIAEKFERVYLEAAGSGTNSDR